MVRMARLSHPELQAEGREALGVVGTFETNLFPMTYFEQITCPNCYQKNINYEQVFKCLRPMGGIALKKKKSFLNQASGVITEAMSCLDITFL